MGAHRSDETPDHEVAGYAYYDRTERLVAVATINPTETRMTALLRTAEPDRTNPEIFDPTHRRVFSAVSEGAEDPETLTVKPIFWNNGLRIALTNAMTKRLRETDPEVHLGLKSLMHSELTALLCGDHGGHDASNYQPAAHLARHG